MWQLAGVRACTTAHVSLAAMGPTVKTVSIPAPMEITTAPLEEYPPAPTLVLEPFHALASRDTLETERLAKV